MASSHNPLSTQLDTKEIEALKAELAKYRKHLQESLGKKFLTEEVLFSAKEEVEKKEDKPRRKHSQVEELETLLDASVDAFLLKYPAYQVNLSDVRGMNPLTNLHIVSTHGKALDKAIRTIIPNLEQNPAYLIGVLSHALDEYRLTYLYKTIDDNQKALIKRCRILSDEFEDSSRLPHSMALFLKDYDAILDEIKKVEDGQKGFFSSVSKVLSQSPERKLFDIICQVHDNVFKAEWQLKIPSMKK